MNSTFCSDLTKKAVHLYLYVVPTSCLNYGSGSQHLILLFVQLCHISNQINSLNSPTFLSFKKNPSEHRDVPITSYSYLPGILTSIRLVGWYQQRSLKLIYLASVWMLTQAVFPTNSETLSKARYCIRVLEI